jgi:hypothetical protein
LEIQTIKGEILTINREIKTRNSFCLDCRPKKFKTGEIQTKTAKSKYKICETIKKQIFCFDFANLLFRFPGFSKESGKSKLKKSKIQTIMRENPNIKEVFLFFGFCRFFVWVSRILVWIWLFLYLDFPN